MILFLVDNVLNIIYKKRIIKFKLPGIINQGLIVNKDKFINEFKKLCKKEKIREKIFGSIITVVKNTYYSISDINYLENTFLEYGFIKVEFINILDLLPENNSDIYLEINNTYMVLNLKDKGIFLDLAYFKDIPKIINYFKDELQNNLILFGVNKNIPNIKVDNRTIYYYENYNSYIVDSLLKINK